jgi:diguanylate cyclase (GGDEF)-like protein/PAS domain S-box-containing protein
MNRAPTWVIVLLYAASSVLWVAVAGYIISLTLDDPALRTRAYLVNELILVTISTALFYLLLKIGKDTRAVPIVHPPHPVRLNRLLLMLVPLAMVAPLVSIGIVNMYGPEIERGTYADLQTISDLKAEQIELWLDERHGDAETLAVSQTLIERVVNLRTEKDGRIRQLIVNRLEAVRRAYSYESVLLLDANRETLLALGEQRKLPAVTQALLADALSTDRIESTDLFLDENGKPCLDILVPLTPRPGNEQPVAVVILRANLELFLIPLVERWPGNSPSAEILLIRQVGETVRHLNKLQHNSNANPNNLTERSIVSRNMLASVVEGQRGTAQGTDYRGEAIFAAYRPIVGSDWRLLAKIDRAEVFAQLWVLVFWVTVVILVAIAAVSLVLLLLWRQQRKAQQLAFMVHAAEQDRLLKYFYELPFIGMAITSPDNKRWLRFNDQLCEILGYSREELERRTWVEVTHPDDVTKDIAEFERVIRGESEGYAMDKRYIRKDGSIVVASLDVKCVRKGDGKVNYFIAMIRDVTEQRRQRSEILAARSQLQATLDAIPDLLFELDSQGYCHACHSARARLPGFSAEDLIGRRITDIFSPDTGDAIALALQEAQDKGFSAGKQVKMELPLGILWFELSVSRKQAELGCEWRFIMLARDVTERRAAEQHIKNLAHYDILTGLPNRALLADRLKVAIRRAARQGSRLAVLFADLDRFKPINDSLGHDVGDKLLKAVAERMQDSVRSEDTVSRVGGDEFVVLLTEIESAEDVARVAEKLIAEMSRPYQIEEHDLTVMASVGICIYPDNGTDPSILLRNADASMYSAKQAGRNRYHFYSEEMTSRAIERLSLEHDLRSASSRNELFLMYQPQIEISTGNITGVEVLARWRHPAHGLISPLRFIPVAEDTGLILPLGERALRESCLHTRSWLQRGLLDACICVNISGVQFRQTDFVQHVQEALEDTGLPPDKLELELTENVLMQTIEAALEKLRELRALGVRIAIDDYGAGCSSLSSLRQFMIGRLKIGQSFVRDLPGDRNAESVAAAIMAIGRSMDLRVIAEGVETQAQVEFLKEMSCKEAQGYLFAAPMTRPEFEAWLAERRADKEATTPPGLNRSE